VSSKIKNKQSVAVNAICVLKSALKIRTIVPNMKTDAKHFLFMLSYKIYSNFLERKKESINLLQIDIASSNIRRLGKFSLFFFLTHLFQ